MPNKKWIFWVLLLWLIPLSVFAYQGHSAQPRCVMLGSQPSLIIKFRHYSSDHKKPLPTQFIQKLAIPSVSFTHARPMALGSYIVFFTPKKSLTSQQVMPGCYPLSTVEELTNEIKAKAEVESVTPNSLSRLSTLNTKALAPPVPGPGVKQWDLLAPPGGIDAVTAYATTTGSPHAIVAVLDSGILPNTSLAPNALPGATFSNNGETIISGATPSCNASCLGYDHGTHVAGTIAASGNLAYGENIYGVAFTSKVLPINVFTKFTNPADCNPSPAPCIGSWTSDQLNALSWLNGTAYAGLSPAPYVTTVNMSLGGLGACSIQAGINPLLAKQISFAIAAGNEDADAATSSPANCTGVMAVAATGPQGYGAPYSNYGAIVSFAAPGGDSDNYGLAGEIYSTIENAYGYKEGTSMASPHAAGVSALLYSVDPTLTPDAVTLILRTTAEPFPTTAPPATNCTIAKPCGAGIINASAAVIIAAGLAPTLSAPVLTPTPAITSVTLNWTASTWDTPVTTPIIYTVNLNGTNVASCTGISGLTCTITGLNPSTLYNAYVSATDVRSIYTPVQSVVTPFTTNAMTGPVVTTAARNPNNESQVFVNYSSLSNPPGNSYTVSGIPGGAVVTLDAANNRFIISHILTATQITNVYITAIYGAFSANSNHFTIPNFVVSPLVITVADRNPLLTTQAFVYYSSLPNYPGISYTITGTPAGASIQYDAAHSRFVVSNITTPKEIDNVQVIASTGIDTFVSNYFTIPNIM